MIPSDHLLAFTLTAFALIAVPGPSVLFAISRALVLGRRGALGTVVGNAFGAYTQAIAVAIGIGAIVERSIVVFTAIKLAGAAYLVFLGIQAIRHRHALTAVLAASGEPKRMSRVVWEGYVVGVSNPKAMVFFAAVLPQFVDPRAGHVPVQMVVLGAVFMLIALVSDATWALGAGAARSWLARSPARLARIGGVGGLVMIGIGARLAVTGRHD